jgi:signal transduction histidine kinase/ligand-binding sensor domain-containing protein/CheY-like chemotaxis protein
MNRPSPHVTPASVNSLVPFLLAGAVMAQHPITVPATAPFVVTSWNSANGLPQNSVSEVVQGDDGMLWVATFGGLGRFDGQEWTVYDASTTPGFGDSRITALAKATDGSIWFGSELGIVSRFSRPGALGRVAEFEQQLVNHLAALPGGGMVCCTTDGVWEIDVDGGRRTVASESLRRVTCVRVLPKGELLVGSRDGLHHVSAGTAKCASTQQILAIADAGDGSCWVGTQQGLFRWRDGVLEAATELTRSVSGAAAVQAVLTSRSGRVWLGTAREVVSFDPATGAALHMPTTTPVHCLAEDRNGGVWVGLLGAGLCRFAACEAEGVGLEDRDQRALAGNSVLGDADGFWIGTRSGLFCLGEGKPRRIDAVPDSGIGGLHRDADGTLWIGMSAGVGWLRDGRFESVATPQSFGVVRAFARDSQGKLLVGTEDGLWVYVGADGFERFAPAPLPGLCVKMIQPRDDGGLWVVTKQMVVRLDAAHAVVEKLRCGEHLPLAEVRAILESPTGRTWFATYGAGFCGRKAGHATAVGLGEGLVDAYLCSAIPHSHGWLVGGNRGPFLVDPQSLDRIADGTSARVVCRTLSHNAAISAEANGGVQSSIAVRPGGAALCSVGGLWLIRDDRLRTDRAAPICHVLPLPTAGQVVETSGVGASVRVRTDRTVVVACTAPEFDNPTNVNFRWRFAGGTWSEPSPRRSISVAVPDPGSFTAEFVAIDSRGGQSAATRLQIVVEPRLWEHGWFAWVAAALVGSGVFAAFRFGSRRSARQAANLRALVDIRTADLVQTRDSLEQRVAQRTGELETALRQLEHDHARRSQLERELQQMRRMESLGQLAGSVAHDFNNLLTVVIGNVQVLELELGGHPGAADLTRRILEAAARGRDLTQRLLAVASRQAVVPAVLDVAAALRTQVGVVRDLMGSSVEVVLVVGDAPLRMLAAPGQIDQIVMNLAVNARAAMPNGGRFTLKAERVGGLLRLFVRDSGAGMTPEVLQRAFEPFFTTRVGRGTGLGLATVYGITKQLGGEVEVESEPGRGTCFTFHFPAVVDEGVPVAPPVVVPRPTKPTAASERRRILLVEDEPDVRRAMRMLLESWGCVVVGESGSGGEAVRLLAESGLAVDVVVSDVRMPGLTGRDLVQALRGMRPGLPIVFVSGHTSSASLVAELAPLGIELIAKPPARDEMIGALERAVLGARAAGG